MEGGNKLPAELALERALALAEPELEIILAKDGDKSAPHRKICTPCLGKTIKTAVVAAITAAVPESLPESAMVIEAIPSCDSHIGFRLCGLPGMLPIGEKQRLSEQNPKLVGWIEEALEESMAEELIAADSYRERAAYAESKGDQKRADLWKHVASEEDKHYREFRDSLGK
jgi:hypothetical protein